MQVTSLTPQSVGELPGGERVAETLDACSSSILSLLDFTPQHGDVFFVEHPCVRESTFEELVYDLYYQKKSPVVRALWRFRGWLGATLGWERHPADGVFPNQWRDPTQHIAVGQKVSFMNVVHVDAVGEEVIFHIHHRMVEAYFVVKRSACRLYFGTIVRPFGKWGRLYWQVIQPAHKLIMRDWMAGCGRTHAQRLA